MSDIDDNIAAEAAKVQAKLKGEEPIVEDEEIVVNPVNEEATKLGWRPKEEYEGDEEWVDAGEFLRRKPLFDAITSSNKKYKKVVEKMDLMVDEFNKQQQAGYDKALADISKAKEEAVELGDVEAYKALEKKEKEVAPTPIEPVVNKEYEEFLEINEWYDTDIQLTRYADGTASYIKSQNPQINNKDLFEQVVKEVKEAFPAKFSNQNKSKPAAVVIESNSKGATKGTFKYTKHDLPEEVLKVYHELVTHGPLEAKQFLEGYANRGGTFIERGN